MAADELAGLYERHALAYDQDRSRSLTEQVWLDRLLALLPPRPTVLDLGCGMGEPIAQYLIGRGCAIMGIDTSPAFIALCQRRFPDHMWQVGDMRTVELPQPFDAILAWNSFFHLPHADQRHMFGRFRRYAAPGAALLFTSGTNHGESIGTYQGEPLYHASLDTAEYQTLLRNHGFSVVSHIVSDPTCGHLTVWLARQNQAAAGSRTADR